MANTLPSSLDAIGVQLVAAGVWATVTELPRALLLTPLDNIRIIQSCSYDLGLKSAGLVACATYIRRTSGIKGFWRGVIAACAYDLTLRLVMPRICDLTDAALTYFFGPVDSKKQPGTALWRKVVIGFAGQFGALFIAQPLGIAHVRMAVDLATPHKYKSVFDFYRLIFRQESVASLFRGSSILAVRSVVTSLLRFSLEFLVDRPKSARGIFFYTLLMTNVPDLFKLPMDALRLRVIIGDPQQPANDYARYILTKKCPVRLFDGFWTNVLINGVYSLTAMAAVYAQNKAEESAAEQDDD